jgi:L-ascorbate metabolism protein UlaG (beta-lactamase superfamily)
MSSAGPGLEVTYIRTSTVLLRSADRVILTDPWFAMRMRFLPALRRPGVALSAIPRPDLILCSHLHADHFEPAAVAALARPETVLVGPRGTAARRPRDFAGSVVEMVPGQRGSVRGVPVDAFAMRHTFPPPAELGYRVELGGFVLFFGGDAAYGPGFAEAGRLGPVDVAILPVGGSRIWGRRTVMDAADAWQAACDLGARHVVPVHPGGDWLSLPPLSRHPGRLEDLLDLGAPANGPVPVVLQPGRTALFRPGQEPFVS